MALRFGTDGVRARALTELTTDYAESLGRAAAAALGAGVFYVGRDTRESGPALEDAVVAGLVTGGVEVRRLAVVPTPAVAYLCAADEAAGVVISASHNPWHDNGLKLFGPGGLKLSDSAQDEIQALLDAGSGLESGASGSVVDVPEATERYTSYLLDEFSDSRLAGMKVVVDCANGSNSVVAPAVLDSLGVDAIVLSDQPDGRNINDGCGSTYLDALAEVVLANPGRIGLAFDGDADRVLAIDEEGEDVDGDRIIALCAGHMSSQGTLVRDTVVVTVMANLGFHLAMADRDISVEATPVGDRYVLEALDAGGLSLGGEQSGHVIFRSLATTGDGLLTALKLLEVVAASGRPLHELATEVFTQVPQVLENVSFEGAFDPDHPAVSEAMRASESELGDRGRVLLRSSGTEPLVRIMVEALDEEKIEPIVERLRDAVLAQS